MKRSELFIHIANNEAYAWEGLLFDGKEIDKGSEDIMTYAFTQPSRFTLKPRTHTVNGFEVPAPMVEAGDYWLTNIDYPEDVASITWDGDEIDHYRLKYSLCFATKEHAELNRKAQLGINPYGEGE